MLAIFSKMNAPAPLSVTKRQMRPLFFIALTVSFVGALLVPSSSAQKREDEQKYLRKYSGAWGEIEAGFIPDSTNIITGEPLFLMFVVRNTGTKPLAFQWGGDGRGSVRENRFTIVARPVESHFPLLRDPHGYSHGGGVLGRTQLGSGEVHQRPLLLQHWVELFDGKFPLERDQRKGAQVSETVLGVMAGIPLEMERDRDKTEFIQITSGFLLTLRYGDEDGLAKVVKRLQKKCAGDDEQEREKAWQALGFVKHSSAVDALLGELHRVAPNRSSDDAEYVIRALKEHRDDSRVFDALVEFARNPKHGDWPRETACRFLADHDSPKVRALFLHMTEHETSAIQRDAIRYLGWLKETKALPLLRKIMSQTKPDDTIRAELAHAMCSIGEKLDGDWVMPLIHSWSGQDQTYSGAIRTIREFGTMQDLKALAAFLRDDQVGAVSSFNDAIITAIQYRGGPKLPYRWVEPSNIVDRELIEQNRSTLDAYRKWSKQPVGDGEERDKK